MLFQRDEREWLCKIVRGATRFGDFFNDFLKYIKNDFFSDFLSIVLIGMKNLHMRYREHMDRIQGLYPLCGSYAQVIQRQCWSIVNNVNIFNKSIRILY